MTVEIPALCNVFTSIHQLFFHIISPCPYLCLLHIMCGYQCDKAVTKNDTFEVIYHFTAVK